eukprot:6936681-Prymnesium_polylepis.1
MAHVARGTCEEHAWHPARARCVGVGACARPRARPCARLAREAHVVIRAPFAALGRPLGTQARRLHPPTDRRRRLQRELAVG